MMFLYLYLTLTFKQMFSSRVGTFIWWHVVQCTGTPYNKIEKEKHVKEKNASSI